MSYDFSKSDSISNSFKLLERIISDPSVAKEFDISLFEDQKRFAHLDLPQEKIMPMSLNRLKFYADEVLPFGWKGLDALRKKAVQAITIQNQRKKQSRGSKKDLEQRLAESKSQAQSYLNEIARFSEQYKHLIEICHIQARNDADFACLFYKHLKRYTHTDNPLSIVNDKNV